MRTEHAGQPAGERESLFVYQAAEHYMRHGCELALNGRADMRMIVAVARGPPRRDAVDQFASISQHDPAAVRRCNGKRKGRRLHLRIGQPDMLEPGRVPGRICFG